MSEARVFQRLRKGLSKTSEALTEGLATAVLGKKELDDDLIMEIEDRLVMADVGIETTNNIISDLVTRVSRTIPCNKPLIMGRIRPFVMLVVGVNGAGKTTTIGKIAQRLVEYRQTVILAAGDTFRAAAVEQLQEWGKRINAPVIAQKSGADSAAVVFDAYQSAKARNVNVLIADTAGRLHTQQNLMEELKKIKRALQKINPEAPHETLLVLEGGTGQNAINQAIEFHQALGITGIAITKLDGSAKGGIVLAIADKLKLPIRYIGVGEAVEDLRVFNAYQYAGALLGREPITAEIT
ncbi:MAG: signal recognition particle-docking protein FtsY [Gammaproteobacteria bacterium]